MRTRLLTMGLGALAMMLAGCESTYRSTAAGMRMHKASSSAEGAAASPAAVAATGAEAAEADGGGFRKDIQSDTLTAGSFDDCADSRHYYEFVAPLSDGGPIAALAKRCHARPIVLRVRDAAGRGVGQAEVRVRAAPGRDAVVLRTRTDGRCVLLAPWDGLGGVDSLDVEVAAPGAADVLRTTIAAAQLEHTLTAAGAVARLPDVLDLAFIVDCTGSMADELEYLKVEIRQIAEAVARRFPKVRQRYALIAYRDKGDQYVTRVFDFSDSLSAFAKRLGAQRAGGGGDYPEAVDQALSAAGQLRWSEGNAARVAFHVADAPPHDELCERALRAVDALRAKAVAIYPVASSGVAEVAEFTMRTEALLTGAEYLFLTDDSGVGLAHAKPHFPHYHVQKLSRAMIRMIASELSGRRIPPEPGHILRTVTAQEDPQQ
jgi:hypothetical protein